MGSTTPSDNGLNAVLTKIGRASTPQVPDNSLGLTLPRALRCESWLNLKTDFFGVISGCLFESLQDRNYTVVAATPGLSHQILPENFAGVVVIDRLAFDEGTWLGAISETAAKLREEVYELCRKARKNGIPVWFLDRPAITEPFGITRIKSASDVVMPIINPEEFEEGAKISESFTLIMSLVEARFASENYK